MKAVSVFLGLIFAAAAFSYRLPLHHTFVLYPFPQFVIAFAVWTVGRWLALRGRRALVVPAAALLFLSGFEVMALGDYLFHLRRFGGLGVASDATSHLADWINTRERRKVVFVSEASLGDALRLKCPGVGFSTVYAPMDMSREGAVQDLAAAKDRFRRTLPATFVRALYAKRFPWFHYFDFFGTWKETLRGNERPVRFYDRDGLLAFEVYHLTPEDFPSGP